MTGGLNFPNSQARRSSARWCRAHRSGAVRLSYDYVGDLSETVALMWRIRRRSPHALGRRSLAEAVDALREHTAAETPKLIARLLDALDETGRWAL